MTSDSTDIVASIVKTIEPERSPSASQRIAGLAQDQLAAQGVAEADRRKVDNSDKVERAKLKRDGEKRRGGNPRSRQPRPDGREHTIDTLA